MTYPNDPGQAQWPSTPPQPTPVPYPQAAAPPAAPYGQPQQPGWAPGYGAPAAAYPPAATGMPGAGYPPAGPAGPGTGYPPGGFPGARSYKEPAVAWVLWVFLGFFGGHQFYLGNTKRAVFYLVGALLSMLTLVVFIGILGYITLLVFWIIDATQMSANIQKCNAQAFAANRAAGLA